MNNIIFTKRGGIALCLFLFWGVNASAQDWESITTPINSNLILYDISFPKGQDEVGFTGGAHLTYNGHGTIMKTEDKGATWNVIYQSNVNGTGVSSINFLDLQKGFAGTQAGNIMTTIDGGANWTSSDLDPNVDQGEIRAIVFYDENRGVLLTGWEGVYVTEDGGSTWAPATTDLTGPAYSITYADEQVLFAVGNQQKIYKSTDGGYTWTTNFTGNNSGNVNIGVDFSDVSHGLVTSEEGNIFVTTDGGENWTGYVVPNQNGLMRGALVVDENVMYATGTPGTVYKSINGGVNWTQETETDFNPSYYKIIMTESGHLFVSGSGATGGTILRKLAPAPLSVSMAITNVSCNGESNGSIALSVTGGVAPYIYIWSNDAMSSEITGLTAGTYSCIVIDAAGVLLESDTFIVSEPPAIDVSVVVSDETIEGLADGAVDVTISGGTPGYTYAWDNGASSEDLESLEDGTYCLSVTDANGCSSTTCATVLAGVVSTTNIPNLTAFRLFPNPVITNQGATLQLQFSESSDIKVEVINAQGTQVYDFTDFNTVSIQKPIEVMALPAGTYVVKVIDLENGYFVSKQLIKVK